MPEICVCHEEVARLHQFFEDWFQGRLSAAEFSLCENALAPGFTIVTPGGQLVEREEILEAIRIHGGGEPESFRISTVPRGCQRLNGLHVSMYEEHQMGTRSTVRLSSAVLSDDAGLMRWHTVHETWITS